MGATLDETRLELEAQRARVRGTADRLEVEVRKAMNPASIIRRHPGQTAAAIAGLAFLVLGGPRRTVRFVRQSVRGRADGDRAYASLPPVLRSLVDDTASGFGDSKSEAKRQMALALLAWRADPKNRKKADKAISLALTPPGPERVFWTAVEVVAVTGSAILTRQVLAKRLSQFLGGRPPAAAEPASEASDTPVPGPAPKAGRAPAPSGPAETGYSGWSGRRDSVAGPAKEPRRAPAESTRSGSKGA